MIEKVKEFYGKAKAWVVETYTRIALFVAGVVAFVAYVADYF